MRKEFQPALVGQRAAVEVGEIFSECLDKLDALIPPGRERSLVITKLEEASLWAKRAIGAQADKAG